MSKKYSGLTRAEVNRLVFTKHGHARAGHITRTWRCWALMRDRCRNPNNRQWKDWGGRGITFCDRWESFTTFLADMGEKPKGLTLGRIDNNGPYCPENCRWETWLDQNRNRRSNRIFTVAGVTGCMTELAGHFGLSVQTVSARINGRGWSVERAFLTRTLMPLRAQGSQELPLTSVQLQLPFPRKVRDCS